ncbi:MAG TPA: methyltransferase domain-containing protein [Gemmatimonadota bacterium]|jgi:SAM-dependent methyltransferase
MSETPGQDPATFKAEQRRAWSRAAQGWERWWDTVEQAAQGVSDRLVELAAVGPGQRVLDVGTGIGEPALTAARRVGPAGRVVALDQAPMMLAVARRRMASLGLPNVEFVEGDLDALELTERFDAIVSRWALMFSLDVDATLARLVALLVPGGRLAAAVWDEAPRVPISSLPSRVIRGALGLPDPAPGVPTPFDLADPALLVARLERAGLVDVATEWRTVTFEFASTGEFARFVRDLARPIPELERLPPERQDSIWAAVADAAREFADAQGSIRMPNQALLVAGTRPRTAGGGEGSAVTREVRCPFCGGADTRLESAFGSTVGFAQYWCDGCRTVFEYLKWDEEPPRGA